MMNKESAIRIINNALQEGRKTLSEYESKQVLALYDIPVTREILLTDKTEVQKAARKIGYPLVMKGCCAAVAHKTEKGLIHVDIRTIDEAQKAFDKIMAGLKGFDGAVLMQEMVYGNISILQIAEMAAKYTGAKITIKPSNDPRSYRVSSSKLLATGFKPSKTVEDAVKEIVHAYQSDELKDEDQYYNLKGMQHSGLASQ